jgi:hypothetical protein
MLQRVVWGTNVGFTPQTKKIQKSNGLNFELWLHVVPAGPRPLPLFDLDAA